ncbi:MAG: TetR/AcrR family transcriptional regulator [Heliobacteriaceae bacterium]|nr:TetR/AcrR family transcriptional regulator [Heliobacteriaceae bacterium]MDD4587260.1 TetR/AcrR family transcriptional regulator [Heliobacteriaceae bacterium]
MSKTYLKRKDGIILTAIEIVDQLGIQGLTIREIATRQGISEAAIYRHFANKKEILLGVLEYFASFDLLLRRTVESQKMTAREGIIFLVGSYSEYYENYPAISAVLFSVEAFQLEPDVYHKMVEIMDARLRFINELVANGQRQGEFADHINSNNLVDIIFGTMHFVTLRWRINRDFELKEYMLSALFTILDRFSTKVKMIQLPNADEGSSPVKIGEFLEKPKEKK